MSLSTAAALRMPASYPRAKPDVEGARASTAAQNPWWLDGLSQNVTFLGKSFHIQTEACDGKLRTEAFHRGRLLTAREIQLDEEERYSKAKQRQRLLEHHRGMVSAVRERARNDALCREPRIPESGPAAPTLIPEEVQAMPSPQPRSSPLKQAGSPRKNTMPKIRLEPLASIDGFVGTCLVDSDSGMMFGAHAAGSVNLELAAAGNTQVVRAKRKAMASMKITDPIEEILISLKTEYHLIRPLRSHQATFLYLVLDRGKANLALARHELRAFEAGLSLS